MPEKKKKGRRAYLSDYVLNAAGEYVIRSKRSSII